MITLLLCYKRLPQVGERTHAKATQTETSPPLHSASPSSTLHHTFTTDLTLVSCGCSKCSIYRSEAGCLEGYCCLALKAKIKLVPLTPTKATSDTSVGYSSIYKSIKLFKGLITLTLYRATVSAVRYGTYCAYGMIIYI